MVDYTSFSPEELAMDASFQNWVKRLNQDDILFWEHWAQAHPEKATAVATASALVHLLHMPRQAPPPADIDEAIRQVRQRMAADEPRAAERPLVTRVRPWERAGWRVAAVLLALVVATVVWYVRFRQPTDGLDYVTRYGEKREVTLPDGSQVVLSGNSHLRISPEWTDGPADGQRAGDREVWLEGMAYFKVTHRSRSRHRDLPVKFIVHAGNVNVEVVGTEFNVSNRREKVQVLLNSGKVQLRIGDRQPRRLAMQPGELFEMTKQTNRVRQQKVDTRPYTVWQEGELRLDHTSMTEIAKIIEEAYGYPVVIETESLKTREVTGVIQNRDLNFLLQTLSTILSIEATKTDGKVVFRAAAETE
ncbi:MAG: FecR domain-containing protein [Cytophagales bacterium]|nr:FecR domain-containing protein [Cytophagales bacterium]